MELTSTFCDFYKVGSNNVFILPDVSLAANFLFEFLRPRIEKGGLAFPLNATKLASASIEHFNLVDYLDLIDISLIDFGLDYNDLNTSDASTIWAYNAYGCASSYILGRQGRYTIEDSTESPFAPNTGMGDIILTVVPNTRYGVLITRDEQARVHFARLINNFSIKLDEAQKDQISVALYDRFTLFHAQMMAAHTFFKICPATIQTANILCHTFSAIPLLLSKDNKFILNSSGLGTSYEIHPIIDSEPINFENGTRVFNDGILVRFKEFSLQAISSLNGRLSNYIDSVVNK